MNEEIETKNESLASGKKSIWLFVVIGIIVIAVVGFVAYSLGKSKPEEENEESNIKTKQDFSSEKIKFEYFPARFEDFAQPPAMYGLWAYGVKGKTSSDHNEGHPGWDFELKKGSKVYAIADLFIDQIHEGDHSAAGITPEVIEATATLQDGRYHIVYHSVINLESEVKEGATIKAGKPLAEVGLSLSQNSAMIHFGIFPPRDSVGACPSPYFADTLQKTIADIVAISVNQDTKKAFESACIGKINRELYLKNYPEREKDLGGAEQWE
jgi:hypothetical protein